LNAAATSARRGEIAFTRLRYAEAAKHLGNAAAVFRPGSAHEDARIGFLQAEAGALLLQGDEYGDNGALLAAVERFKQLLELTPYERVPLEWAKSQDALGVALRTLGAREGGTAKLEEAVAAYREALKVRTREREPLLWAETQHNLAAAVFSLGTRERGTAKLEEAVTAYREAMKESTRDRVPREWARIQANLGAVLSYLGELDRGGRHRLPRSSQRKHA
jgi:tetratricopeptide (TPR) repeat protein